MASPWTEALSLLQAKRQFGRVGPRSRAYRVAPVLGNRGTPLEKCARSRSACSRRCFSFRHSLAYCPARRAILCSR